MRPFVYLILLSCLPFCAPAQSPLNTYLNAISKQKAEIDSVAKASDSLPRQLFIDEKFAASHNLELKSQGKCVRKWVAKKIKGGSKIASMEQTILAFESKEKALEFYNSHLLGLSEGNNKSAPKDMDTALTGAAEQLSIHHYASTTNSIPPSKHCGNIYTCVVDKYIVRIRVSGCGDQSSEFLFLVKEAAGRIKS